jgi:two-component system sensor histidine kinase YesM
LQPILENAVTHGIRQLKDRKGSVKISGKLHGGNIELSVSDNGNGISGDKLSDIERILEENALTESPHIGLRNVNARIKLVYGDGYGLKIISSENGTTVTAAFPKLNVGT